MAKSLSKFRLNEDDGRELRDLEVTIENIEHFLSTNTVKTRDALRDACDEIVQQHRWVDNTEYAFRKRFHDAQDAGVLDLQNGRAQAILKALTEAKIAYSHMAAAENQGMLTDTKTFIRFFESYQRMIKALWSISEIEGWKKYGAKL
jgi:hypothetical protein